MEVGDFVKGKPESDGKYAFTNSKMTRGVVVEVNDNMITVKILEHTNGCIGKHRVDPEFFEVTGHVKPFNRDEILELLRNGCKKAVLDYDLSGANLSGADLRRANLSEANLSEANLSGADLRRADLDFSCLPLKCGGLKWHIDKRLACQLAYHLCSMQCDDSEYIQMRNALLPFANQFHRVGECEKLEPITEEKPHDTP
jgi:hypothetical protein